MKTELRGLVRDRSFSLAVVLTLAFGIAANSMVLGIYDAVIRGALPFAEPGRLTSIWLEQAAQGSDLERTSLPDFGDWRDQATSFGGMAAMTQTLATFLDGDEPEQAYGAPVSGSFLEVMGTRPWLGRGFSREDAEKGGKVILLGNRLWRDRYGSDRGILGRAIDMDGTPYTVIGVMPPGFRFPAWADYWVPLESLSAPPAEREFRWLLVVARLAPGVSLAAAQGEMDAIMERLARTYPRSDAGYRTRLVPVVQELVGDVHPLVRILFVAAGLLILIACVNVTNLMLVRGLARERESAVRVSLGAGRAALVRRFAVEIGTLGALGGVLGLGLALAVLRVVAAFHPPEMARLASVHLTGRSVLLTAVLAFGAAALAGLVPLLRIWRSDLAQVLREQAPRASFSSRLSRLQGVLVVSQVALTLVLLVGTGLMAKNLYLALGTNPGYRAENLLTLKIQLPGSRYRDEDRKGQFFEAALARLERIPDVRAAGATSALEGEAPALTPFRIVGRPPVPGAEDAKQAANEAVTPGYFRTLGVPLIEGRWFSERDVPGALRVALINEAMAKRFWPGSEPVGQRLVFWDPSYGSQPPGSDLPQWTVVGVVGDSRRFGYASAPWPEMYIPFAQNVRRGMRLVLRTSVGPHRLTDAVRSAIRELDPKLPIQDERTMKEILGGPLSRSRLNLILSALFTLGGVVLAGIGLYGVMAYSVARRRHEMGIRSALGAQRRDVARGVVTQAAALLVPGLVLGLAGGWAFGRVLRSQLPRVTPADPWIAVGACLLVALAAAPAVLFSAWRVLSTDPSVVLREE